MKRFIALLMAGLTSLALVGCAADTSLRPVSERGGGTADTDREQGSGPAGS